MKVVQTLEAFDQVLKRNILHFEGETPVGSLASQAYHQNNGWFSFGITFIWDSGPPTVRPSSPAR